MSRTGAGGAAFSLSVSAGTSSPPSALTTKFLFLLLNLETTLIFFAIVAVVEARDIIVFVFFDFILL